MALISVDMRQPDVTAGKKKASKSAEIRVVPLGISSLEIRHKLSQTRSRIGFVSNPDKA
jgi:hypothetical protein